RQPSRWTDIVRQLGRITDSQGVPLSNRVLRYSACDAQADPLELLDGTMVQPFYTLGDQLFVEPQPHAAPDAFDLERPIMMSQAEVAVACSHIGVWKTIANPGFDILYVSYGEVRHGAPKELVSKNVFRPERGLWYLSGYVLSKKGAQALLDLLPCCGPIDLWINHKFRELDVRALRRSVINQRRDLYSTNSYSILPALSRIGVLDNVDAALFRGRPIHSPVFAFGSPGSGLSSLAMALSMLGYRCCNDFESIPEAELESLLAGRTDRVFDAYVNIGSLEPHIRVLVQHYPRAKYILMDGTDKPSEPYNTAVLAVLEGADLLRLRLEPRGASLWRALCEYLKLAPPNAQYPSVDDVGLRTRQRVLPRRKMVAASRRLRHDPSPWIAKPSKDWSGIRVSMLDKQKSLGALRVCFEDDFAQIQSGRWLLRNDTFPGNLGMFRPANVTAASGGGLSFSVIEEPLGVRNLSAAAISSCASYLFGRFDATLQATNVPGLLTGFFLHRDSPRQEIDIEILGNRPDQLLANVFYNPGPNGAKFDYGYRGTPVTIELGFDASKDFHKYTIEWDSCEIAWFVDRKLVHHRAIWDPTPIPHLPMTLHVNTWPTASRELAGRLALRALPASAIVRRVAVDTHDPDSPGQPATAKP
ncbi:MAG: family 16 glycosylhydrolase, partial [Candidatus Acidiferrales bacterium]